MKTKIVFLIRGNMDAECLCFNLFDNDHDYILIMRLRVHMPRCDDFYVVKFHYIGLDRNRIIRLSIIRWKFYTGKFSENWARFERIFQILPDIQSNPKFAPDI